MGTVMLERGHRFEQVDGRWRRRNELWRRVTDKSNGITIAEEFLFANDGEVKYEPTPEAQRLTSSVQYANI